MLDSTRHDNVHILWIVP